MIALPLALFLAAAPAPVPDKPAAPYAVMPFKDLSGDAELAWLSVGIAETMMADLQKGSHLEVVERNQLNHALAELALQGLKTTDESNATKLGKMVGARTVVLGSYQKAGDQVRIVARMVDVETGVVRDAAKVTGKQKDIFELQDAIVVKLAGTPFDDAVKKHRRKQAKQPEKMLKAYRLYAQSFTIMSDVERAVVLENALKEDPDFIYAAEDLLDLQDRIKRLSDAHEVAVTKQIEALRTKMKDGSGQPQARLTSAMQLLGAESASRRYHAELRDSEWIIQSKLPDDGQYNIRQFALFQRMMAYSQLKEEGLAMQVAENFMSLYPASMYFTGVQSMLNNWISERARALDEDRKFPAELALKEQQIQHEKDQYAKNGREPSPNTAFGWQNDRCDLMEGRNQHQAAVRCYQDMLAHPIDAPELKQRYFSVRIWLIREAANAAEFETARRECERFQKEEPEAAMRYSIGSQLLSLPTD